MTGTNEREDKLLGGMLCYIMRGKEGVSFTQLSKDLEFMDRTTTWRNSWKSLLHDKKFIVPLDAKASVFTSEHKLTQAGKDHASTPEYEEYLKELNFVPQTNEEHQERIKKRLLNNKARSIFGLLMKYGHLSRKHLSELLKCNDRQHEFSYGLKDLREKNLVCKDGAKFSLEDSAFLDPSTDRPKPHDLDEALLLEGRASIESKKRAGNKSSKKKAKIDSGISNEGSSEDSSN